MFNKLSEKIRFSLNQLGKQARLTEENTASTLEEVRLALLEADTAVPVVQALITTLKQQAVGEKVQKSLNPGQAFIKIVYQELVKILGETHQTLNLRASPPAVIMVVGAQGSGKTTSLAKIALWLKKKNHKKVLLASLDQSRPAAVEQLNFLANQAGLDFYYKQKPVLELAKSALDQAKLGGYDCLLVDTAGRMQTSDSLMAEIKEIHKIIQPVETLYVLDAMGGQDAIRVATGFKENLAITAILITKLDSTSRGGAILSVRYLLNLPIKLVANGENLTDIVDFNPNSIANLILGMGDTLALIRKTEMVASDSNKPVKIKSFNFNHLRDQLVQLEKMGGLSSLVEKMGASKQIANMTQRQLGSGQMKKFIALIDSMTPAERKNPRLLNGSRKMRISKGAGSSMQEINQMLKRFKQLQKLAKKSNRNPKKLMQGFKQILPSPI